MTFTYGECESALGAAANAAINSMWQQGAAEGISEFVASGDSGAAGCDAGHVSNPPVAYLAQYGLAVSGLASTPCNVAVGGSDFQWINLATSYWNSTNSANYSSALGYIPEVPWNSTCASDDVRQALQLGGYTAVEACNTMWTIHQAGLNLYDLFLNAVGGTGGASSVYAKPAWQTGTGVPADGYRDVPDVALFASNNALNSAYVFCDSELGPCNFAVPADTQGIGGTSLSSPAMAGIMALVLQKLGGTAQGLPNPVFYQLASQENLSNCNSNTVAGGNNCVFYDITKDNNEVPCATASTPPFQASPDCSAAGNAVGILSGYVANTGYDLATGLGSVNAYNLVNAWFNQTNQPAVMTVPAPSSILGGASTSFAWTPGSAGTTGYYLWVGAAPGTANLVNVGPLAGTGYTANLPTNGATIYVRLWTVFNGTTFVYNDYTYTAAYPATMTSPTPGSTLNGASTTFTWTPVPSGTTGYFLWIGSAPGTANLANIGELFGTSYTANLPTNGATIYVRLWTDISGVGKALLYNDYTYTEFTQALGAITSPVPGSTLTGASTTFNWSPGSTGTTGYYLWAGTAPGTANLVNVGLAGTSYTANLPTGGATIYVRLWTVFNGTTLLYNDYTYTEFTRVLGAITSPTPGSTLTGASTTFNWSAGSAGTTGYYLWVGTAPGTANLVNVGLAGTSYTANLPTNGATIYVRLWTVFNGTTLLYNDYTYTEFTRVLGAITSPTPGSTLTGASTTFNWSAGSAGTTGYYLWVGTAPGTANLVNVGLAGTSYTANLPTGGATIYVRLWTVFNGTTFLY
jgi:hypothetical protein